jgi:hypothetical protein
MEAVIGSSIAAAPYSSASSSVLQTLEDLDARLSLLQPEQLDKISSRVSALLHDLTAIAKLQEGQTAVHASMCTAAESMQLQTIDEKLGVGYIYIYMYI